MSFEEGKPGGTYSLPYHYHGNSAAHRFATENRCYIDHRGERRMSAPEYQILTATTESPKPGGFYRDADNDLFIWIGTGPEGDTYPWLQIEANGAYTRSATFVAEPLYELSPEKYAEAINELRS